MSGNQPLKLPSLPRCVEDYFLASFLIRAGAPRTADFVSSDHVLAWRLTVAGGSPIFRIFRFIQIDAIATNLTG